MTDIIAPSSLAITQAVGLFSTFLPKLTDVRRAQQSDPEFAADVHLGELACLGLLVGIGVMMASLTESYTPLAIALVMGLFLTLVYEYALACPPDSIKIGA